MKRFTLAACLGIAALLPGCKGEDQPKTAGGGGSDPAPKTAIDTPAPAATQHSDSDDHANSVPLGEQTKNGLKLAATQDEAVKAGAEAAFDLDITGDKPKAVRFWVGTENGEGSVKAKAEEEEKPGHWHAHAEVPDPLPAGSKFWAEVEPATGEPFTVSFDLKAE